MAAKLTPQQSPQSTSSSFWQLISGVASDLDLMLQDLFPDSIPSPLREEYGLAHDITVEEAFTNQPSLLEQFVRGAEEETQPIPYEVSIGEYRSSKSILPDTPTSDSYDGRTTPTSTSSPSPPPPAPPPRTLQYSDYTTNNIHCMSSIASGGGGGGGQPILVSSSSVSSVQETSDGDSSHASSSFAPCDIGLLERLIRTHPIWFLPGIGRAGAIHLLQGKDEGNFIVRQSSKPNTMALSVRLPENKGPYVEHYLIETVGDAQLRLEGSDNSFHAIPMLVAHYCQCCDELPVQLALPRTLTQAASRQELSSLALLGQDFWLSSLVQSPNSGSPPQDFPPTSQNGVQHSTFKPTTQDTSKQRKGPSPPPPVPVDSEPVASEEKAPPVAPKHQDRGAPPPPPPRSFLTLKSPSCVNLPPLPNTDSSSELSSPISNDFNRKSCSDVEKLLDKDKASLENKGSKGAASPYKQSNIVDLPPTYYRSSLADKISDYEDIWGNSQEKSNLLSFKSTLKKVDSRYNDSLSRKNFEILKHKQAESIVLTKLKYTQGTQTEVPSMQITLEMVQSEFNVPPSNFRRVDAERTNRSVVIFSEDVTHSPNEEGKFSSPFYSEPVDSLPLMGVLADSTSVFNPQVNCFSQRLLNHRYSDPNLHWPQSAASKKVDALDEERIASLSSSVDNIKGMGPSPERRRQKKSALNIDWVGELQRRVSTHNLLKKDSETQVSMFDLQKQKTASSKAKVQTNVSWPLDSSWEWLAQEDSSEDDANFSTLDYKFPLHIKNEPPENHCDDLTTVEELIALTSPELALPSVKPLTESNVMKASEYDNLGCPPDSQEDHQKHNTSEIIDDTATEFSEPWDSLRWERLLHLVIPETDILGDDDISQQDKLENFQNSLLEGRLKNGVEENVSPSTKYEDSESLSTVSAVSDVTSDGNDDALLSEHQSLGLDRRRNKSFQERLEPLLAAHRVGALRNVSSIGGNIRQYIFRLADERNNIFAMSIENFIQCTKESNETNPAVVMRNIRQFMSGMKNYLVKNGEGQFEHLVQEERSKLKSTEFLNIDAIIEDALHKLVIKPLKTFLHQLFVNEYTRNGSLKLLSDNIKFARTKTPEELGVRPQFKPPEGASLEVVQHFLNSLQREYSPLRKLENLLAAISTIYNSVQQDKHDHNKDYTSLAADDFLPIFICVLVRCGLIAAEIEADYMWGLLHPSLMYGECSYYLTTLSSAVHVLKSLQACSPETSPSSEGFEPLCSSEEGGRNAADLASPKAPVCKTSSPEPRLPSIADLQGFMKIMIPNELTGSIISKTLPVRPNMTTKDVVKMIAHKFNVTNPQDYCLFKLVNGEETQLGDNECPQTIKADLLASGTDCVFAYKRCDAKFVWPMMEH